MSSTRSTQGSWEPGSSAVPITFRVPRAQSQDAHACQFSAAARPARSRYRADSRSRCCGTSASTGTARRPPPTRSGTGSPSGSIADFPPASSTGPIRPLVALHFATENTSEFDQDGIVWCVNFVKANRRLPARLKRLLQKEGSDTLTVEMLSAFRPFANSMRSAASRLSCSSNHPPSISASSINSPCSR